VPAIATAVGAALIAVGIWGYASGGDDPSPTALIPAALGLILVACGLLAFWRPGARKHAMHAAAAVGLIGILGVIQQLIMKPAAGTEHADVARTSGILTLILCVILVGFAVRSFIAARAARRVAEASQPTQPA
jgi:peptidoglycan/LPS O-acetylase OafA/YrhL